MKDDEDEYEEGSGENRLLGFMFGNVDNSGDLDVDYLDEDAKEHLAALADKLGQSLTEIDLSTKSPQTPSDGTEQVDYDKKAENAVDYEDIDEQYEGPEVQAATEEDFLLPRKDFFSKEVSVPTSVFDDENYDEDEDEADLEKQTMVVEDNYETRQLSPSETLRHSLTELSEGERLPKVIQDEDKHEMETLESNVVDSEEDTNVSEEPIDGNQSPMLPVLYVEDGKAILRFSEIFGIHDPIKKVEKRDRRNMTPKEKFKSFQAATIVEEDEENYLKAPCRDFSWMKPFHCKVELATLDDGRELMKSGTGRGTGEMAVGFDQPTKDSCVSSEPLRNFPLFSISPKWNSPLSPIFYPFDQQDWEDEIIWNNSPSSSEYFIESCELSGPDSDSLADKDRELEAEAQTYQPKVQSELHDKGSFQNSYISVEPFRSEEFSQFSNLSPAESRYHPQLLRLQSRLDRDTSNTEGEKDGAAETKASYAVKCFARLGLQNRTLMEGSWLDGIIWEPHQSVAKTKLILDLQDEQMLFEVPDSKDVNHLRSHAGAMIISRSVLPSGDSPELHGHGFPSAARFNISNDKYYSNRKSSQQLRSHSKKRTVHGLKVLHSVPALKLQTMKVKLSNKDTANFHRPKALWYPHDIEVPLKEYVKPATHGSMKIIMKSLGGRGSKLHVDAEEIISNVKAKASKKLDFKLSEPVRIFHSGRELEDNSALAEQNVRPNSVLHLIRTKIHLLPRAQKLPGENKSLRPPGAFKKKSDLSVKDGHVFLMEYCEERPLLLGNPGMGARLCTYYQKSSPGDQTGTLLRNGNNELGSVVILDPADKSPFLGDLKAGSRQSCLETNMYKAPIFRHKVSSTDYLLVRSAKGKLSIRRIDRIDVVGQQEPHIEVMAPGSKAVQFYVMNRLLVYMYREFRAAEKRGLRPSIRADELSAMLPGLSEVFLRKRLKNCADFQRGANGHFLWVMKRNFRIPSEEELRRMVTPENVCAYESMQAGLYRLKRLGITRLTLPAGLSSAMNQLPDEAITLAAASHIERELQITPWNLSSNFVSCTNQDRENIERLEITGVGDPSGRGLGFSYVRATPKAPVSNSMVKKKPVVGKGSTVTGTDADLRRLSMEAARELLLKFNVPEEQIAKQTRWHRIALIRKLSSEQAASGVKVDPTTVSKFARGQRMSFLQLQQQTREKCQEIWDRQVQSLRAVDGEENESESEANSDLDSFAGDLENLLDAEEGEEGEDSHYESKHDNVDGVKGLKMRRHPFQTQVEEEIEDEAAEAAELCRMLMDGHLRRLIVSMFSETLVLKSGEISFNVFLEDEADRKNRKKTRAEVQVGQASKLKYAAEHAAVVKKSNAAAKRHVQPEGLAVPTDDFIKEPKEIHMDLSARVNLPGKVKVKKKNDIEQMGLLNKKVKILADGMSVIKEKKSARDSFVCGACGQLGHMRTNKNCPRYGEDPETRVESTDLGKLSSKSNFIDQAESSQPKSLSRNAFPKSLTKVVGFEVTDDDKPTSKAKTLKVKCGATDKFSETSQGSDKQILSDYDTGNKATVKVNKIIFSNRTKPEDLLGESHKPSIVIKPPAEADRDQHRKKIIIKQPKEMVNSEDNYLDGSFDFDYRKTKKIVELSSFDMRKEQEIKTFYEEPSRTRGADSNEWWEEDKRGKPERQQEERYKRLEKVRNTEEQPTYIMMYANGIRREREEEEELKKATAKAKKTKKRSHEIMDDYLDNVPLRRNDRRIPERDRMVLRKPSSEYVKHAPEYPQPSKRRRGGEVGLSNILENIVETLKDRKEISLLFLKPVSKKDAPDYLDIIDRPMDLATIRDKVRRLEYKNRDDFRHDVYQIVFNAHRYNDGRNPGIPPLADQLLELCDYLLDQYDADLSEAEAGIN
ncbi:transcription initiation factor TFIID subunit 1 [Dorcoceras hygrometricum]|uniref:Transcription initiation factor TFIID subunit 1 n=1 Tax=Dorcoceras hygrometricum TaxID=472368 RepID=A0A2Z7AMR5_9LAMI|nr:transcription initiation factor TFIID subunit 1 [Dorcoceras hygrometricum]